MIAALERGGADLIELGVPFSDPVADGPVIQRGAERALKAGATLKGNGLKILSDGLILDSYANLAASLTADWTGEARAACKALLTRLDASGGLQGRLSGELA